MGLVNIDYTQQSNNLNVPILRQTKFTQWVHFLVNQLVFWKNRADDWTGGTTYTAYNSGTTYSLNNIVQYDKLNYLYINATSSSGNNPPNSTYWYLLPGNFIGLDERITYNSQKLKFEMALNRWFGVAVFLKTQWTNVAAPQANSQIYIVRTANSNSNFWLSNGGVGGLVSYMGNTNNAQQYFLGNAYTHQPYSFTIYVPSALFTAIGLSNPPPNTGSAGAIATISAIANKYTRAGKSFQILTY